MATSSWRTTGEVVEREELLDGRSQVVLEGEALSEGGADGAAAAGGEAAVTLTLVWLLGRDGEVPLTEAYITLVGSDHNAGVAGELNASLEAGTAEVSAETGAAVVRATFVVDAVEGGLAEPGARLACDLEVGAEEWGGELRLDDGERNGGESS
ncbi:MAG: hypothetical protein O2895_06260 [Chloroflexi bacterium]|nr:hypothetical protein [Chloroflexota bacterium]